MFENIIRFVIIGGAILALLLQTYFRLLQLGEKRTKISEDWRVSLIRGLLGLIFFFLPLYCLWTGWLIKPWIIFKSIGYLTLVCAFLIRIWSQTSLGTNWSTGIKLAKKHELIQVGPYKYIRHPMYISYLLTAFGMVCLTMNVCLMIPWAFYLYMVFVRASNEEALLAQRFGSAWTLYAKKTGMFWPKSKGGIS